MVRRSQWGLSETPKKKGIYIVGGPLRLDLHPVQGKAFLSNSKITLCAAGLQSGKTTVGSLWTIRQNQPWGRGDTAIISAPTYKILNQSTIPTFLKYSSQFGEYKKADQEFHYKNGVIAYIRTGTEPDSIEGIQNVRWIWGDESGKFKYRFWVNLEGRAARTNAPIFLTTTPYSLNWMYKDLVKASKNGTRDDVSLFNWKSYENPSFPREHFERQKQLLDAVTFAMKYEGSFQKRVGLVFPLDESQIIEPFQMPEGTKYYAGLDWGFTNPMALIIRGLTPDGRDIQVSEFYESGVYPDDIAHLVKQKTQSYNIEKIVADPADPGKIAQLQKYGLPVMAADNNKETGIDAHQQVIRSNRHFIFSTCPHTIDEYETYSYKENDEDDKNAKEEPINVKNHAMDANKYLSLWFKQSGKGLDARPRVHNNQISGRPEASPTSHIPPWKRKQTESKGPEFY